MTKQIVLEIGQVFGRLTVIGNCMHGRYSAAICQCTCGNIKTVKRYSLTMTNKPTRSCGCLALEAARIALKCDRGSSFANPEEYALHRKAWLKEYGKVYDARPEQRALRKTQKAAWLENMTLAERQRQIDMRRTAYQKPQNKARAAQADKAYRANPVNAEKIKIYHKSYSAKQSTELTDRYVAACFLQESNLTPKDLPPSVIDAVRQAMLIRRAVRERNHEKRN